MTRESETFNSQSVILAGKCIFQLVVDLALGRRSGIVF